MEEVRERLEILRAQHRELDERIADRAQGATIDQLELARLKRQKLRLRDEIALCEDALIPDIIA